MKNLKKLSTILLFALTAFTSNAQVSDGAPSIGVKGGVNFSNFYTKDVKDENVLTGLNLGMYVNVPLNENISFQPEINFTTKGSEVTYDNFLANGKAKFSLSYIEVPVLFKANLAKNFNLHVGPYFAYLVDSKITNESSNPNFNFEQNIDENDLNKFDAGISGGIGFDFDKIGIGARYNYGLTTIGKERNYLGSTYTFPDAKNSNLNIYVAVKF